MVLLLLVASGCVRKPHDATNPPEATPSDSADGDTSGAGRLTLGPTIAGPGLAELVDASGGVAAWLSRDKVLTVLDVAVPASPSIRGNVSTPGFAEVASHDDRYVYVADSKELRILSSADPLGVAVGTFALSGFWPSAIGVDGGKVFLASGNQIMIVDARNPARPSEISRLTLTGNAPDAILVWRDHAYVVMTLGGLNVVDVRDPGSPRVATVIPFESHTVGFAIRDGYAYLARVASIQSTGDQQGYTASSVVEVFDLAAPASPRKVGSVEFPTNVLGLALSGDYIFLLGDHPHRLTAVDVRSPTDPKWVDLPDVIVGEARLQAMTVVNGHAYVADGLGRVRVVDVREATAPRYVTDVEVDGRAFRIHGVGNRVFVTVEQKHFNVADVRDPTNPVLAHSRTFRAGSEYTSLVVRGGKAYFNGNTLNVLDLADPFAPREVPVGTVAVDGFRLQGNYLYSVIGEIGLDVFDVSNLSSPRHLSRTPFPVGIPRDLSVDGPWAVGISNVPYSVNVFDVTDPIHPIPRDSYRYDAYANTVTVKGDRAYVARGAQGVDILEIQQNGTPVLRSNIGGNDQAHHVAVSGTTAFLLRGGVAAYDVSDLSTPRLLDQTQTRGQPTRAAVDGGAVFVADGWSGMTVVLIGGSV